MPTRAFDLLAALMAGVDAEPLTVTYSKPTWMAQGACVGADTSIFFPAPGHWKERDRAKAMCATCGVRTLCLDFALADRELVGVFGGTTEQDRARMRRTGRKGRAA